MNKVTKKFVDRCAAQRAMISQIESLGINAWRANNKNKRLWVRFDENDHPISLTPAYGPNRLIDNDGSMVEFSITGGFPQVRGYLGWLEAHARIGNLETVLARAAKRGSSVNPGSGGTLMVTDEIVDAEFTDITAVADLTTRDNVILLPYQPQEKVVLPAEEMIENISDCREETIEPSETRNFVIKEYGVYRPLNMSRKTRAA